MSTIDLKNQAGDVVGTVELDPAIFGVQPNVPVMHQVVTAQLAARRAGTHSTKTRAEVSGGGAKPYRQKGTGRARQGSIRAPHWRGGGVAMGPKPRNYKQRTPKKMVRLALYSALSDRANEEKVVVVDRWAFETPKTKDAITALSALGTDGKVLVVLDATDDTAARSFRNLPWVHFLSVGELNAYDVLCSDWVVFTQDVLPRTNGETTAHTEPSEAAVTINKAEADDEPDAEPEADADANVAGETAEEEE